jgi:hypothetical protein
MDLVAQFFHPMNCSDARRITELHQLQHGIDGMVGSLDCMYVSWKNCPVAWQGQFHGKEEYPTMVLEVMCNYNLYFWHHEFGLAGMLNDVSIWDMSGLHKAFMDGTWSEEIDFPFTINGELFQQLWVTVDGIYPELAHFVKMLSQPIEPKQASYAKWQEQTRKDIEHGFGVLQSKFRFLVQKVELWSIQDIVSLVNCCILLHNWMVTVRVSRNESKSRDLYDHGDGSINTGDDSGANTGDGGNARSDENILNATNNVATSSDPAYHHIQLLPPNQNKKFSGNDSCAKFGMI